MSGKEDDLPTKIVSYMKRTAKEEAAPQLIDQIEQVEIEPMLHDLNSKIKKLSHIANFETRADIYKIDEGNGIGYIVLTPPGIKEAIYFVHYVAVEPRDLAGIKAGRQIMVWRENLTDRAALSTDFSNYVFFKVLLPKYKTIAADRQQTEYGRAFWALSLSRAFQNGNHVYVVDHTTELPKMTKYKSIGALLKDKHKIWGRVHMFQKISPIISLVPLNV